MSNNLANLLASGPATVTFGGTTMLFKNGINLSPDLATFDIEIDNYGVVAQAIDSANFSLSGTPAGVWGDHAALFRCLKQRVGDFVVPVMPIGTQAAGSLTVPSNTLVNGDTVYISGYGAYTLPTGLAAKTLYYVHVAGATVTLHASAADAIAGANAIAFTADGTGDLALVQEQPLIITSSRGKRITLWNVGVVQPPKIKPGPKNTIFGDVKFEAFRRHGCAWSDDNSLYTIVNAVYVDPAYDPNALTPKIFTASWGDTAPWKELSANNGFEFDAGLSLSEQSFDDVGIVNRIIERIAPTVSFVPVGISEKDILAVLPLQGANKARGMLTSTISHNFVLTGPGAYIKLYAAALSKVGIRYNRKEPRANEHVFTATQSFTGVAPNQVANPLALIADADPTPAP